MNIIENLQEKYIAYLDVLGFKELVDGSNVLKLEVYFQTVKDTLQLLRNGKKEIDSLLISDSIILIAQPTREDFKILIRAVQTIQAKLAQKDIWMRGAISFGEVYFDKESNLIVGKGLVKAYLLESEEIYPRVIIDTSIILRIASDRRLFFNFINPNPDNFNDKLKLVHNYFQFIEDDSFFIAYAHRILLDSIKKRNIHLIYKKIKKNLYSDSKHFKKFLWVKNYFSGVLLELSNNWEITFNNSINNKELINQQYIKRWWHKFNEL